MDNKKIGMIAASVLALIVAAGVIYWTYKSQQVEVVKFVDGGVGTNPKIQAMKAQQSGKPEKDPNSLGDK